ncbi:hypothetical protein A5698_08440 [Mycobacterium sp. E136]|nr:hypothetical protein A5698_08440 [Mycobacterium sp. E136]
MRAHRHSIRSLRDDPLETFHPCRGQRRPIESVDGLHLTPQRVVDFVYATRVWDWPEIVAHQQAESVPLQHQAQPTVMLLASEVRKRIRHPYRQPGRDRPGYRCDDGFDLGQVVVRGGRA